MLTKIEEYRRAVDDCAAKAEFARLPEIRALWSSLGSSYRYLLEREERLAAEKPARTVF